MKKLICLLFLLSCGVYLLLKSSEEVTEEKPVLSTQLDLLSDSRVNSPPKNNPILQESEAEESALHSAFERYTHTTPQETLIGLFKDPNLQKDRIELILQLVEHGVIGINEPLREGNRSEHYTPFFAALATNYNNITLEQFKRFMDLGAVIDTSNTWMRQLSHIRDPEIIELWFDEARIGPEQYRKIFDSALTGGSLELADYVYEKMGGEISFVQYDKNTANEYIGYIKQLENTGRTSFNEDRYHNTGRIAVHQMLESEIGGTLNYRGQIDVLLKYADLDHQQTIELKKIADKLQQKKQALENYLTTLYP